MKTTRYSMRPLLEKGRDIASVGWAGCLTALHLPNRSVLAPRVAGATWVRELKEMPLSTIRGHVAVLLTFDPTWVEWGIFAACWLRRLGLAPLLVFSGRAIDTLYGRQPGLRGVYDSLRQGSFWKDAGGIPDSRFIDLDEEETPGKKALAEWEGFASDWSHTAAAYDLRVEENEEGPDRSRYLQRVETRKTDLMLWGAKAAGLFKRLDAHLRINRLVAYSGTIDVSSAVGEAARRTGWNVAFVEGFGAAPGHMLCTVNAPALDWNPRAWMNDENTSGDRVCRIDDFLVAQEAADASRVPWLANPVLYQRSSVDGHLPEALTRFLEGEEVRFLMTPNVIADSGTMRRATIFRSQRQWISSVCNFFQTHPAWKLLIRAHPAEWIMRSKVRIPVGDLAKEAAGGATNIFVVSGAEKTSTYRLMRGVTAGLVWMSNTGVDMVIRGVTAVAAARPTCSGLGIVEEPRSEKEYFERIEGLASCRTIPTSAQREMARRYISLLYTERTFHAFSKSFRAADVHVAGHPIDGDFERFYRVVAGDLPLRTRPWVGERVTVAQR